MIFLWCQQTRPNPLFTCSSKSRLSSCASENLTEAQHQIASEPARPSAQREACSSQNQTDKNNRRKKNIKQYFDKPKCELLRFPRSMMKTSFLKALKWLGVDWGELQNSFQPVLSWLKLLLGVGLKSFNPPVFLHDCFFPDIETLFQKKHFSLEAHILG